MCGKAPGRLSPVVAEMILALPLAAVFLIWNLFSIHYLSPADDIVISWHVIVVWFLAKTPAAKEMSKFRGICLIDVLAKWYMNILCILLDQTSHPQWFLSFPYYGGRGLGAENVHFAFDLLFENCAEMYKLTPVGLF